MKGIHSSVQSFPMWNLRVVSNYSFLGRFLYNFNSYFISFAKHCGPKMLRTRDMSNQSVQHSLWTFNQPLPHGTVIILWGFIYLSAWYKQFFYSLPNIFSFCEFAKFCRPMVFRKESLFKECIWNCGVLQAMSTRAIQLLRSCIYLCTWWNNI